MLFLSFSIDPGWMGWERLSKTLFQGSMRSEKGISKETCTVIKSEKLNFLNCP